MSMHRLRRAVALFVLLAAGTLAQAGGAGWEPADPETVKDDPALALRWIYDDVERGFATAKKTGKPLLIVFR